MSDFNTTLTSIRSGIECFNRIKDSASNRHRSVCNELSDLERSISEKLTNFEARLDTIYMEMNSLRENQNEDNQSQTTQNINRLQAEAEQIRQKASQLESLKSRCEMLSERYYSSASALMSSITTNASDGVSLMNAYMRKIEGIEGYASANSYGTGESGGVASVSCVSDSPFNSSRDASLSEIREESLAEYNAWPLLRNADMGSHDQSQDASNINKKHNRDSNGYVAALMATYGLTQKADFGNLDNRTAQDIYASVVETLEMFPEIELRFVGSIQARNQQLANHFSHAYLEVYREKYPCATDEQLMPYVREHVQEVMESFVPADVTIAQSLFVGEPSTSREEIISMYNGISINELYGNDYERFSEVRRADVNSKWKPAGCYSPRATVDHELGHQIAKLTNAHNDSYIQEWYYRFVSYNSEQRGDLLSGYAGTSIHEFIAEGWSEYRNNPHCRPLAQSIANRLLELYTQHPKHLVKVRR